MSNIKFYEEMFEKAVKLIKDSIDLMDVKNDIMRIDDAKCNINSYELSYIMKLDAELREKYPTINLMLQVASSMPAVYKKGSTQDMSAVGNGVEQALQQDRCGILCHVLLKKKVIQNLKDAIKYVEED